MNKYTFKDFLPIIILYAIALIAVVVKLCLSDAWTWHIAMYSFMGFTLLFFGCFKIINLKRFADAYQIYDLLAQRSKFYAILYPFIEVALGLTYLFDWHLKITNLMTLTIMLISAAGVARALSKHQDIQCACMGTVFKLPMTYVTLLEDLLMAFMAFIMLL